MKGTGIEATILWRENDKNKEASNYEWKAQNMELWKNYTKGTRDIWNNFMKENDKSKKADKCEWKAKNMESWKSYTKGNWDRWNSFMKGK